MMVNMYGESRWLNMIKKERQIELLDDVIHILSSSSLNWYSTIKTPFEALIKIELDDNLTMEEKIYVAFHVGRYLENAVGCL